MPASNPFWRVAVLCMLSSVAAAQTCIIVAIDSNQITVGADGKTVSPVAAPIMQCKIKHGKGFFYSIAGFSHDILHPEFVPDSIIAHIDSTSADAVIKTIESRITEPLEVYYEGLRKDMPGFYYERFMKRPVSALAVIIFGFAHGRPFMLARDFVAPQSMDAPMKMEIERFEEFGNHFEIQRAGVYSDADARLRTLGQEYCRGFTAEALYAAIESQIKADPAEVGYPISILQLRRDKMTWIHRGNCKN